MSTRAPTRARHAPDSSLDLPVTALPGVGEQYEKLLARLEIRTIGDLLWHLPRTYTDRSKFTPLRQLRPSKTETTVEAVLGRISQRRTARGQVMTEVVLIDPGDRLPTNVRMKASPMTFSYRGSQYVVVAAGPNVICLGL